MNVAPSASVSPAAMPNGGTDFAFEPADFERVRRLIYDRAGIHLGAAKRAMVYSRLSRRLRDLGHPSFSSYLRWLEASPEVSTRDEWQEFVNCLTTNLTAFFREEHHFPVLEAELRRRAGRRLRIWCNAASTGEEPYSIAMTVIEALGPRAEVRIVCSDINTRVLASAEAGVYPADSRGLSPERLRRHFLRGTGANEGFVRVRPELRRLVEFRVVNLAEPKWRMDEPMDIVFCRNVMIYFDAATQRAVLERMHGAMTPGGRLFAGHSENFADSRDLFRPLGKTVYERV
ncbi:MAG: chemotaxis protein CheR [Burkholderiales bacterium]|nr:chemotaxis protein CheR [Burkholderiales bacterium]OJX09078.1 MAG: chemotaxis protein CheR [Burkholderiales bacterium 70-64]